MPSWPTPVADGGGVPESTGIFMPAAQSSGGAIHVRANRRRIQAGFRPLGPVLSWLQMSMLSPRLQLRVAQKQILTPGLVQMVTVLQLNRLELKDMITQEIAENPVLEESVDGIEELTQQEVQALLESERVAEPSDQPILEAVNGAAGADANIIGKLDENGYVMASLEEIAETGEHTLEEVQEGLRVVQSLDPAGIAAKDVRECLLLQIESRNGKGGVAWQIVANH